ncbi:MAG: hypothetical protein D6706_12990 [Chloroflexi bacterium]|nr:MAG: hypothetical protein D6706_12990 [Chloroflexota bacterium]
MSSLPTLSSLQQAILAAVNSYPGQFTRSGLAKMLVGAKSWRDMSFPEYGRFSRYRRKDVSYQIEIMLQQGLLRLDNRGYLVPPECA